MYGYLTYDKGGGHGLEGQGQEDFSKAGNVLLFKNPHGDYVIS